MSIVRSFYVDDFLGSFDDVETARKVRIKLTETLRKGGFELLKWKSSHRGVLDEENDSDEVTLEEIDDIVESDKVLGVRYSFRRDVFFFYVKPEKVEKEIRTKRQLLKTLASCYDPLGMIAAFMLQAKLLFQKAVKLELGWDDELPVELKKEIRKWQNQIPEMSQYKIHR